MQKQTTTNQMRISKSSLFRACSSEGVICILAETQRQKDEKENSMVGRKESLQVCQVIVCLPEFLPGQ